MLYARDGERTQASYDKRTNISLPSRPLGRRVHERKWQETLD